MKVSDISDWQKGINYDMLANVAPDGCIIKAMEGTAEAECLREHYEALKVKGVPVGVYCLTTARTTDDAKREAHAVLNLIERYGINPELGIWHDVEQEQAESHRNAVNTAIASAFISTCNEWGYSAGIYGTYSTLTDHVNTWELADYVPYWVAQYGASRCDWKDENPDKLVMGWQFDDNCFLGDGTRIDLNEWYD